MNRYFKILLIPAVLFLVLLPVSWSINFYQNDDWCYYLTVERFLSGNFTLHHYVGPTFYIQGIMGMIFSSFFGVTHLPVLTLLVACLALYFFILITTEFLNVDYKWSVLIGLVLFFNPLGVYELWGFMTGHFFELFLLSALYFFLKYEKTSSKWFMAAYFSLVFLGLLVRQTALVLPLSIALYYLTKRNFRLSVLNFIYFLLLYYFYSNILPLTPRILEVPLQFERFLEFEYPYAVIYGSLIVLAAYSIPLVFNAIDFKSLTSSKLRALAYLGVALIAYFGLNMMFKPMAVSWGEFPYFENVVERTGFYPRGIHGTKYYFAGNYDLWRYWDIAAKVLLASFVAYLRVSFRNKLNIFIIYIVVYLGLMVVTKTYYDRYIYTILPIALLYLLSISNSLKSFTKMLLVIFALFLFYISYLFSADFILVNKYIWERSNKLVSEKNADPEEVHGTNAWKLTHRNVSRDYKYFFSYDSPVINNDLRVTHRLVEEHAIDFRLNIFVNPKIYLYEKILQ